jgi:hypothetical protein
MTNKTKTEIKAFFQTGDRPTESQFIDFIDSYVDKSGPIGTLETACSAGSQGVVITDSGGTPSIASYATVRTSMGITMYTTALATTGLAGIFTTTADVSSMVAGALVATTAQANAGTATGVVMNPVVTKNAIETLAFTSAKFATTAQANAGTNDGTIMNPVLVKNAIAALGSSSGGITAIASGSLATGSPSAVDITSIPQTYRGLMLHIEAASNDTATRALLIDVDFGNGLGNANNEAIVVQINNTTATNVALVNRLWTAVTQTAAQVSSCMFQIMGYQNGGPKQFIARAAVAQTAGSSWNNGTNNIAIHGLFSSNAGTHVAETRGLTGIRITWDNVATGVFDGGTYTLYGIN